MKYRIFQDKIYDDTPPVKEIQSGIYTMNYIEEIDMTVLESFQFNSDQLVDIHDGAYQKIVSEVNQFFQPETKQIMDKLGFIFKKSILLYGRPGTGKTCITTKISELFLQTFTNGVVLFNLDFDAMKSISQTLDKSVPLLVVIEEFDEVCKNYHEETILSLLDGESQRSNTFYIFTTNYIEDVPSRLFRPSRISNLIEVMNPSLETRKLYIKTKLPDLSNRESTEWAQKTDGLNFDDLKHTILATQCYQYSLDDVITELRDNHKHLNKDIKKKQKQWISDRQSRLLQQSLTELIENRGW